MGSFLFFLANLASNPTLVCGVLAGSLGALCSAFKNLLRERVWYLIVPSTLSALCCAITTSIAICHGVHDPLFPLSLGFSFIVMSYSFSLRRYSDAYTRQMLITLSVVGLVQGLDVGVGDSLAQLLVGSVMGCVISIIYCLGSQLIYFMVLANMVSSGFSLYFRIRMPIFPFPWFLDHALPNPKIILATLKSNPAFVSLMLVLILAQSSKVLWKFVREREWNFRMIYRCDGTPSTQSALCSALITSVAMSHGVADPVFALSLGFGLIVMYCAIRLRRFSDLLKVVIRLFLNQMHQENPTIEEEPNLENLGDSIAEVLVGASLGCMLSICTFVEYY